MTEVLHFFISRLIVDSHGAIFKATEILSGQRHLNIVAPIDTVLISIDVTCFHGPPTKKLV